MFNYSICNDEKKCTGCSMCAQICNVGAIKIEPNKEGFLYPQINKEVCRECGKCQKSCPQNHIEKQNCIQTAYAAWSKNSTLRKESSSGGVFSELAEWFIRQGGVVIGAVFDSEFKVEHDVIENIENLYKTRGSKYVQSDTSKIYERVESFIRSGKKVFFTGTPCQVAAIKDYIKYKKLQENLLTTCDLVCHGVPSPIVWKDFLEMLSKKFKSIPISASFRNKDSSWMFFNMKIKFENGMEYKKVSQDDSYTRGFLREYTMRESCYSCQYARPEREGDLTLCDFWGYKSEVEEDKDTDEGISLVITNTIKGEQFFNEIKEKLCVFERTVETGMRGNQSFHKPWKKPENREKFWNDYLKRGYKYVAKKYLYSEEEKRLRKERADKWDRFIHIPNRIVSRILGEKRYSKLKNMLKI